MATAIMKQKEVPEMDDVEEIISKISEESPYKRRPTQLQNVPDSHCMAVGKGNSIAYYWGNQNAVSG